MNYLLKDIFLIISLVMKNILYKSKEDNQDFTLVTATDDLHFEYLENLIENFNKSNGKFNKLIIYGLNLSNELKDKICLSDFIEFREFKFENYPQHFSFRIKEHNNKIGGFAWKPAIIYEIYNEQKTSNIIWLDSACLFDFKLFLFKLLINDRGFASFHSTGNVKDWTHKSVIETTGTQDDETVLNSRNLMGGVLGFNFKNINAVKLLENWYTLCSVPENIFPKGSSINNHRHDQSLISICYWKSFKKILPIHNRLFGITIQNWPNKILYFFDENNNLRETLLERYLFYSTTTNSRCKIIILFNAESLKNIPFRLLFTKKILLFISSENQIQNLEQYKLKKYFIFTFTALNINFAKSKKINFVLNEIDKIIYEEYMKEINA
tara:strand:- start:9064 stop:10206 length:1143 start_codon:yes stop_codon:yes gene_type:complete